jgi:hypothetical protein
VPDVAEIATAVAVSCARQEPPEHVLPVAQENAEPQPPQFAGSVCSLTQLPLQRVGVAPPQPDTHAYVPSARAEHTWFAGHETPQAPQFGLADNGTHPAPVFAQSVAVA